MRPREGDPTDDLVRQFTTAWDVQTLAHCGSAPFTDDPLKGIFYRRLLACEPEATRFYVLLAGETPVAFHFRLLDKQRVIRGMTSFDPRFTASLPANLLDLLVAGARQADGIIYIDQRLTGDAHEGAAATHETTFRVFLHHSAWSARAAVIAEGLRTRARGIGVAAKVQPERLRALRASLARARRRPMRSLAAAFRVATRWVSFLEVVVVYRLDRSSSATPGASA